MHMFSLIVQKYWVTENITKSIKRPLFSQYNVDCMTMKLISKASFLIEIEWSYHSNVLYLPLCCTVTETTRLSNLM